MTESEEIERLRSKVNQGVVSVQSSGGSGSGWVATPNGLLVTNVHVVAYDESVIVRQGDVETSARVVYADTKLDIAFLLPNRAIGSALPMADSRTLIPGVTVYAVGHPLGLPLSMTRGILSAPERPTRHGVLHLQIDAILNPGKSGGPLIVGDGMVVGVNTYTWGDGPNLGFAVPVHSFHEALRETARTPSDQLRARTPLYRCLECDEPFATHHSHCHRCGVSTPFGAGGSFRSYSAEGAQAERTLVTVLAQLGFDPSRVAYGESMWRLPSAEGVETWVEIDPSGRYVVFRSWLAKVPKDNFESVYRFLLAANDVELGTCAVGISYPGIITLRFVEPSAFLNTNHLEQNLAQLLAATRVLSELLRSRWGCEPPPPRWSVAALEGS